MRLWLLTRNYHEGDNDNPANPWHWTWDCAYGFVVRANSESEARQFAADDSGTEGDEAWLNPEWSHCVELTPEGDAGNIIRNFLAG